MDDDDRDSNASSDNDEVMEDVDDVDAEPEPEPDPDPEPDDNDDDADDHDNDDEGDGEGEGDDEENDDTQDNAANGAHAEQDSQQPPAEDKDAMTDPTTKVDGPAQSPSRRSATPAPTKWTPKIKPEIYTAKTYDVVPTMAAPQATSINALAITPDLRYWMTGGLDGYIRKYSGYETINGKQLLTVAQRHPFVDSVVKSGVLVSYWENADVPPVNQAGGGGVRAAGGGEEQVLSPVYSLAIHSQALWLLSGLESGGINLQSVRHDEGKRICCLREHTNAVSVLTLAPDEKSVLSGGWDKKILDWDLNTGQTTRSYDGSGGQISAIELRPAMGDAFPAGSNEEPPSDTFMGDGRRGLTNGALSSFDGAGAGTTNGEAGDNPADSPAHESLFGGSDAGSLFGDTMGGGFGGDEDDEFSQAIGMSLEGDSMNAGGESGSTDLTMTGMEAEGSSMDTTLVPTQSDATVGGTIDTGASLPPPLSTNDTNTTSTNTLQTDPPSSSQTITGPETTQEQSTQEIPDSQATQPPNPTPSSPLLLTSQPPPQTHEPGQVSESTFLSSSFDGTIRIWDRRAPDPVARITPQRGTPPWCMAACWSPSGNTIYAGRRNGTVEEFSIHKARSGWAPERALRFPTGSGAVSAVRAMPNGRHLMCASHDILRLYDLQHETLGSKSATVPFLIVPGPPRAGVISSLWIDPTCKYMVSAAGTRGWEGSCTEVIIGYEISVVNE